MSKNAENDAEPGPSSLNTDSATVAQEDSPAPSFLSRAWRSIREGLAGCGQAAADSEPPAADSEPPAAAEQTVNALPELTRRVLLGVQRVGLLLTVLFFCLILGDMLWLWTRRGITTRQWAEDLPPDWLETVLCFGPRIPAGSMPAGEKPVDDAAAFWKYFGQRFAWNGSSEARSLLARPVQLVMDRLRHLQYQTKQDRFVSDTMPFLFHYSVCTNFTMTGRDAERPSREHVITLRSGRGQEMFDGVAASYVDIYAVSPGMFTEWALVDGAIPYRTDMRQPLALRVSAQRQERVSRPERPCLPGAQKAVNGRLWCLVSELLSAAPCTFPWMDAFLFDRAQIGNITAFFTNDTDALRPADLLRPWMARFSGTRPCRTRAEFRAAFVEIAHILLPDRVPLHPAAQRCFDKHPWSCTEWKVSLQSAGRHPIQFQNDSHTILLKLPVNYEIRHEFWAYETELLLVHLAGLLAFYLGVTVPGAHDCVFAACDRLLRWLRLAAEGDGERAAARRGRRGGKQDRKLDVTKSGFWR